MPLRGSVADSLRIGFEDKAYLDDVLVGLAFSGGGTRAAAFSFGVLQEMEKVLLRGARGPADRAAGFHLWRVRRLGDGGLLRTEENAKRCADFREKFLLAECGGISQHECLAV